MSWSARIVALGTTLSVVACAAIAGLDDPTAVDENNASSSNGGTGSSGNTSSSGSGSSSGSTSTSSSGSSSGSVTDGATDAPQDTAPACTKSPNGAACTQGTTCCSGKCNEKKQCAADCEGSGVFNCNPLADDECCVGLWCDNGGCSGCIAQGQPAGSFPGGAVLNPASCCSRTLSGSNCQ